MMMERTVAMVSMIVVAVEGRKGPGELSQALGEQLYDGAAGCKSAWRHLTCNRTESFAVTAVSHGT